MVADADSRDIAAETHPFVRFGIFEIGRNFRAHNLGFFIDRFFISKHERNRQVHEKAERIFFKKKLHESKSHNALLLFISVLERQIVLLPDPRMKLENIQEMNQKILQILQEAFKKDHYEHGILGALEYLRSELKNKHKKTSITENQFSNTLIWWRD